MRNRRKWFKFVAIPVLISGVLFGGSFWSRFHPWDLFPVVGPAGDAHRAYISERSSSDWSFILFVSDWPHTFYEPLSLGEVRDYDDAYWSIDIFWSADGSVLATRVIKEKGGSPYYREAYDFDDHTFLNEHTEIDTLMALRGGVGMQQLRIPDGKDPEHYP